MGQCQAKLPGIVGPCLCPNVAKYPPAIPKYCTAHDPLHTAGRRHEKRRDLERRAYQELLDEACSPSPYPQLPWPLMDEIREFEKEAGNGS